MTTSLDAVDHVPTAATTAIDYITASITEALVASSLVKNSTDNDTAIISAGEDGATASDGTNDCSSFKSDVAKLALFFFGTIGNVISLLVMRKQTVHARSYALTLTVLTVLNSLTLFALALDAFDQIISNYYGSFEVYIGDLGCKIYRMFPHVMQMASHWVVVLITTERFCAVCFPLSLGRMFTVRGTKIVLSSLLVTVVGSQTWRLAFDYQEEETITEGNGTVSITITVPTGCSARNMPLYFVIDAFVNQLLLLFLLPALFIIVLNTATAWHITRAGRDIRRMSCVDHAMVTRLNAALSNQQHQQSSPLRAQKSEHQFLKITENSFERSRRCSEADAGRSGPPRTANGAMGHRMAPTASFRNSAPDGPGVHRQFTNKIMQHGRLNAQLSTASTTTTNRKKMAILTKFRTRKSIALLLTLTGCFLLCMTPQLTMLLYLRIHHMIYGHEESFLAFLRVCQPLNITTVLTAMNYADNFLIFFVAGRGFRKRIFEYINAHALLRRCCPKRLLSGDFGDTPEKGGGPVPPPGHYDANGNGMKILGPTKSRILDSMDPTNDKDARNNSPISVHRSPEILADIPEESRHLLKGSDSLENPEIIIQNCSESDGATDGLVVGGLTSPNSFTTASNVTPPKTTSSRRCSTKKAADNMQQSMTESQIDRSIEQDPESLSSERNEACCENDEEMMLELELEPAITLATPEDACSPETLRAILIDQKSDL